MAQEARSGGRYRIEREIGKGAFGVVWLAHDAKLDRDVALKVMNMPEGLSEEEMQHLLDRFYREARAAASLTHPNIVIIHDISKSKDTHFISMEFLEGQPLSETIDGPMPVDRALGIAVQLLDALEYAHGKGVIHRDVKPENVFILPGDKVKLVDFGLARLQTSTTMTRTGSVMGSPGYIAPEVIEGRKADARTDIFSVGVTLYEMLTGEMPFGPRTAFESFATVIYRILQEDPKPPSEVNPMVTPELDGIVMRCLEKDPDARYQVVTELKERLAGEIEEGQERPVGVAPVSAGKRSLLERVRDSRTRVLGASKEPPGARRAGTTGTRIDDEEPESRRTRNILLAAGGGLVTAGVVILILFLTGVIGGGSGGSSAGSGGQIKVPNVVNLTVNDARREIRGAGLKVGNVTEVFAVDIWKGKVSKQMPSARARVPRGSTVDLEVSMGNKVVAVPDVIGKPEAEAEQVLKAYQLIPKKVAGNSESFPMGYVIDQNPKAAPEGGNPIVKPQKSVVEIVVNTGQNPPDRLRPPASVPRPPQ